MRILVLFLGSVLLSWSATAAGRVDVTKMKDWTIVVAEDAVPSERYAAEEFQTLFRQAAGMELPIATAPSGKKHNVFIGPGAAMREGRAGFDVDDLGEEGLRIRIRSKNIAIAGGRPRGTLYGVYTFFERYFGARFLTHDHTFVPGPGAVASIPREAISYVPPFSFRWSYYRENADHPEFAAKLRVNTVTNDEKLGGVTRQGLINHSLFKWINPAKYGETHPEYFALVDGERKLDVGGGGPEPCVTNPDVIDIVADGVLAELDANPDRRNISVSQNDNAAYCRCDRCEAINKREGTPMGAHLALVNAVAERVEKKHPDVQVGTLAYWYTRQAPKTIKPRPNVQIQLCSIECCTFHAIDDPACPRNRKFCEDMRAWKAICDDIWVWNYNTNFRCYDLPFPNLRSIGPNVRFFLNNNVKGVFMQANGNGLSGEMSDLRNYVIARCIWDPSLDSWDLVQEFCRLHYAEAAQPILDYLTVLHDNVAERGLHPGCFPSAEEVGLDAAIAGKAVDYFDQAVALAQSDAVRARVEKASICAYKAMIVAGLGAWEYENGAVRRELAQDDQGVVERYIELCGKYNMTMASEGMPIGEYLAQLERTTSMSAVRVENQVWRLTVLPEENGKLVDMFHKPTGRQFLAGMTHADVLRGTHEDIGMLGWEAPLAFDAEVDGPVIALTKTLEDGSTVLRRIALDADRPERIVFSSTLTHHGAAPRAYRFKAHPEFDAGTHSDDHEIVSAYIKNGRWTCFNRAWENEKGPGDAVLKAAKGGGFAFYNHEARFGALVSYDPDQVGRPYLWWHSPWAQINLELFTPTTELQPGQSLTLDYAFQYLAEPPQ